MPIYEYECKKCKEITEILDITGLKKEKIKCPACGSYKLEKIFSVTNVGKSKNTTSRCKETCPLSGPDKADSPWGRYRNDHGRQQRP